MSPPLPSKSKRKHRTDSPTPTDHGNKSEVRSHVVADDSNKSALPKLVSVYMHCKRNVSGNVHKNNC